MSIATSACHPSGRRNAQRAEIQEMALRAAQETHAVVEPALKAAKEANREAQIAEWAAGNASFYNQGVGRVIRWSDQAVTWNKETIQNVKRLSPPNLSITG